jgi:asparagine synthase (glutamine-hydrolysing)
LLQISGLKKRINPEALHHYLSFKHVPSPLSIFAGIYQVPPASILIFHPGSRPKLRQYWQLDYSLQQDFNENEMVDRMAACLERAVRKRLVSDVSIGFFLSGGVDSGILVAIAARSSPSPIKTFTLTYAEEDLTEGKRLDRENARRIAKMYGTEHHEEVIELSDFSEELPRIIHHFDEPFSGVTSTFFLSRLISKHVKVAVSGDGSDEEFGSYLSHRLAPVIYNLTSKGEIPSEYRNLGPIKNLEDLKGFAEKEEWKWRYKLLVFTDEEKQELYSAKFKRLTRGCSTLQVLRRYFSNLTARDALNRMLEAEFRSFLPDQVLTYVDRLSMAHSLEIRAPYLDREFLELTARIPGELKIRDGETKFILKKLALRYLPKDVVYRQKEGFVVPTHILMKRLEGYVRTVLNRQNLQQHNFFNIDYVGRLLDVFYRGTVPEEMKQTLSYKILNLLSFQVWYDLYMASE